MSSLYETPVKSLVEFIKIFAVAIIIAMVIRTFFFQPYVIPSASMRDTLVEGDRIFVAKYSYGIHLPFVKNEIVSLGEPERGDIIVFPSIDPMSLGVDYVKRIVGVGGDVIEIRDKQLYRNGEAVKESYIKHDGSAVQNSPRDNMPEQTIPVGHVFVMGDNRDDSRDSRFWGTVDKKTIVGKAVIIYWSGLNFIEVKWDRIGTLLR